MKNKKNTIVIFTAKSWNLELADAFRDRVKNLFDVVIFDDPEMLYQQCLDPYNPAFIFFPHWSYIIPNDIYNNYECIVFHMTDLPYGRGGSPLQNLLIRGHKDTMISAIRVTKEIDAGDVYLKEPLDLSGSAEDIYKRAANIIFTSMMPRIITEEPTPQPQLGEPIFFKRRKPAESKIDMSMSLEKLYDFIRMLDAEGYPHAFIELEDKRLTFSNASLQGGQLTATITIKGAIDE